MNHMNVYPPLGLHKASFVFILSCILIYMLKYLTFFSIPQFISNRASIFVIIFTNTKTILSVIYTY